MHCFFFNRCSSISSSRLDWYSTVIFIDLLFIVNHRISLCTADDDHIVYPSSSMQCKISSDLQGIYRKQDTTRPSPTSIPRDPMIYEQIFIGPSSIPYWGDCYDNMGDSYIFGLKQVGGTVCYRCLTLIKRSSNIIQVITKGEEFCYDSMQLARLACINSDRITPGQGIFLFKSSNVRAEYCQIEGRARVAYEMRSSSLRCSPKANNGAHVSNCQLGSQLTISLRSCTFPDLEMTMQCMGAWDAENGRSEQYFVMLNEEADEYRCGLFSRSWNGQIHAALSNDSSCSSQLINATSGYETFVFYPEVEKSLPRGNCKFPRWLQGHYDSLIVNGSLITYVQQHPSSIDDRHLSSAIRSIRSRCLGIDNQNRIRVYSQTLCGNPIGYHCLRFQPRSNAVIEFKTSSIVLKSDDATMCTAPGIFAQSSWTTVAIQQSSSSAAINTVDCLHRGHYSTAMLQSNGNCYNLSIDCKRSYSMRLVAYHCHSGAIFDSRQYQCIAVWSEASYFYSYVSRFSDSSIGCFVSRITAGRLYMAWTGKQCRRDMNFTESLSSTTGNEQIYIFDVVDKCDTSSNHQHRIFSNITTTRLKNEIDLIAEQTIEDYKSIAVINRHQSLILLLMIMMIQTCF